MPTIETAAGPARYVVAGSGPPVVFLHGLDGSWRWWRPTLRALAPRYRCYALDFVGFARWREAGRVPLARAPTFVLAWLDALGLDWAHVAAHSLGGYTALALAAAHPERVGRLALVAPAALPVRLGETLRPRLIPATVAPRFLPILARDSLRTGPPRLLRTLRELLAAEPLPLEAVRAPTLILWGARDPLLPPAHGRELARRLPGARLRLLPDAGHVPMYESPAACNATLIRFLSEAS